MRTAVIYARYSSERQTEQSIEGQLRVCYDYAKQHDLIILDTYIDRAMTGTNDNRADFQRLLKDSAKRAWDVVLVYKLDRFSRNKYEMAMHKKTLRDNGIKLISAMENIPETPEGIILESLLEGMAEYYSAELSQKVRRGMNESRLKGQFTGGPIPYGYVIVDKKVVIDEDAANIVRIIYDRYANGVIMSDILDEINGMGLSNSYGRPFAKNSVHRILQNEKYTGVYHYGDQVFTNIYPRIVSDEIFKIVQEKNETNKHGGRKPDVEYLLSRKIKCGYCGYPINGFAGTSHTGKRKRYYCCSSVYSKKRECQKTYVKKEALEEIVIQALHKAFLNEKTIDALADRILKANKKRIESTSILNILKKDLEKVNTSIDNMLLAIEKGVVTNTTTRRLQELENKQRDLEFQITVEESKEKFALKKTDIVKYLKKAQVATIQKLAQMLIKEIILYNDHMDIICNYTTDRTGDRGDPYQDLTFYQTTVDAPKTIDYSEPDKRSPFKVALKF